MAKLLIDNKANPNVYDDQWQTPLICSLRAYIPHADANESADRRKILVDLLLKSKADPNLYRPLNVAVSSSGVPLTVVQSLLS